MHPPHLGGAKTIGIGQHAVQHHRDGNSRDFTVVVNPVFDIPAERFPLFFRCVRLGFIIIDRRTV